MGGIPVYRMTPYPLDERADIETVADLEAA